MSSGPSAPRASRRPARPKKPNQQNAHNAQNHKQKASSDQGKAAKSPVEAIFVVGILGCSPARSLARGEFLNALIEIDAFGPPGDSTRSGRWGAQQLKDFLEIVEKRNSQEIPIDEGREKNRLSSYFDENSATLYIEFSDFYDEDQFQEFFHSFDSSASLGSSACPSLSSMMMETWNSEEIHSFLESPNQERFRMILFLFLSCHSIMIIQNHQNDINMELLILLKLIHSMRNSIAFALIQALSQDFKQKFPPEALAAYYSSSSSPTALSAAAAVENEKFEKIPRKFHDFLLPTQYLPYLTFISPSPNFYGAPKKIVSGSTGSGGGKSSHEPRAEFYSMYRTRYQDQLTLILQRLGLVQQAKQQRMDISTNLTGNIENNQSHTNQNNSSIGANNTNGNYLIHPASSASGVSSASSSSSISSAPAPTRQYQNLYTPTPLTSFSSVNPGNSLNSHHSPLPTPFCFLHPLKSLLLLPLGLKSANHHYFSSLLDNESPDLFSINLDSLASNGGGAGGNSFSSSSPSSPSSIPGFSTVHEEMNKFRPLFMKNIQHLRKILPIQQNAIFPTLEQWKFVAGRVWKAIFPKDGELAGGNEDSSAAAGSSSSLISSSPPLLPDFSLFLDVDMKFSMTRCDRASQVCRRLYHANLPTLYNSHEHSIRIQRSLGQFRDLAIGPAMKSYEKALEEEFHAFWNRNRRRCDYYSISNRPCGLPFGHENEENQTNNNNGSTVAAGAAAVAPPLAHESGYKSRIACSCGFSQQVRLDSFSPVEVNIDYLWNSCCDSVEVLPFFARPTGWNLVKLGDSSDFEPARGIRQPGFKHSIHKLTKWTLGGAGNSGGATAYVGLEYECPLGHRFIQSEGQQKNAKEENSGRASPTGPINSPLSGGAAGATGFPTRDTAILIPCVLCHLGALKLASKLAARRGPQQQHTLEAPTGSPKQTRNPRSSKAPQHRDSAADSLKVVVQEERKRILIDKSKIERAQLRKLWVVTPDKAETRKEAGKARGKAGNLLLFEPNIKTVHMRQHQHQHQHPHQAQLNGPVAGQRTLDSFPPLDFSSLAVNVTPTHGKKLPLPPHSLLAVTFPLSFIRELQAPQQSSATQGVGGSSLAVQELENCWLAKNAVILLQ